MNVGEPVDLFAGDAAHCGKEVFVLGQEGEFVRLGRGIYMRDKSRMRCAVFDFFPAVVNQSVLFLQTLDVIFFGSDFHGLTSLRRCWTISDGSRLSSPIDTILRQAFRTMSCVGHAVSQPEMTRTHSKSGSSRVTHSIRSPAAF